jgi:hypothetical protein
MMTAFRCLQVKGGPSPGYYPHRQHDTERGPTARSTGDVQGTPMRLDNSPAQRQSQPRAYARWFGRKKGLKDAYLKRWRDAQSGVRHNKRDLVLCGVVLRGEGHLSGSRGSTQGLLRVGQEIEEYLLQLVRITPEGGHLLVEVQVHCHIVDSEGISQELYGLRH